MHLVEIFLPLADNEGRRFTDALYGDVRKELIARFGGVTMFSRAPAHGVSAKSGRAVHDEIVVVEVMANELERDWWAAFRRQLEGKFRQDEILIRACTIIKL